MSNRLHKRALHLNPREPQPLALRPEAVSIESLEQRLLLAAHPLRIINGRSFNDLNGNGTRQAREHWLPNVAVFLDLNNNGVQDAGEPSTTTNKTGAFVFRKLARGVYTVVAIPPAGDVATIPTNGIRTVDVTKRPALNLRFGEQAAPAPPIVSKLPDTAPPSANLDAPPITTAGFTPYRFTVVWSDATAVDSTSFGDGNLIVTSGNGFYQPAGLAGLDSATNGSPLTTTYQIPAPATGWTVDTDGTYTINLVGGQIRDTLGNTDGAIALGAYQVEIPGAVPSAPALVGGINNITPANNASTNTALTFNIANTVAGAQLTLEADGIPLTTAVAQDGSTVLSTDGHTKLADGPHQFSVTQTLGNGVESTSAPTTVTVDTAGPTDSLLAPAIVSGGSSTYTFTVTYTDATAVSAATIAGGNLLVTAPSGLRITPTLVSLDANADGPSRIATYRIDAPGGTFTAASDGTYTVALLANEVFDVAHNAAAGRVLGTFAVSIGQSLSPMTGTPMLEPASDTGVYNNDGVTDLNNSSHARALQISVPGVQSGAVVTVYSDGTPIGSANASGTSVVVTTNGSTTLTGGTHFLTASQTTPGHGASSASPALGIVVDSQAPTASSSPAPVNSFGGTSYSFPVVYFDNISVDASHLQTGNVIVSGPNGFSQPATLQALNSHSNGSPRTATYSITPPGGSWSGADDGKYTISLAADQIFDTAGNASPAGAIASFTVNAGLPPSPATSRPDLSAASDSGVSNSDGLTNGNNSSPGATLQFNVANTIAGAMVTIYADGVPIGSAVAADITTAVTTNGTVKLSEGPHTITARQAVPGDGQSADSAGLTITIDTTPPVAGKLKAPDVSAAGAISYAFTVTYTDAQAVDVSKLGNGDLNVTVGNVTIGVAFVSAVPNANNSSIVATYQITPPGGSWSVADNGLYSVNLQPNRVRDTADNFSVAATVGSFTVNLTAPITASPGAPVLAAVSDTGPNSSDGLTDLNNASPAQALTFNVPNTIAGATVTVFADGAPVGAAVASDGNTAVTTLGTIPFGNGQHTITARQQSPGENQSSDSPGSTITVDTTPPTAGSLSAAGVNTGGGTIYTFTIKYSDGRSVDFSSLDNNDVTVIGPGNVTLPASFVSSNPSVNSTSIVAKYQIIPPGGSWNGADNGSYTIALQANQVCDIAGNFVAGGNLGSFTVNLPASMTIAPGAAILAAVSDTGPNSADGLTNLNNSSTSRELTFNVGNTIAGATVTVFADGVPIGAAVTGGSSTAVTTIGTVPLGNGSHTITARQQSPGENQSSDSAGTTITIDTTPPTSGTLSATPVTVAGATSYTFTVKYTDTTSVDWSSLGNGDVKVIAPGNVTLPASFVSSNPSVNSTSIVATYQITPPGGSWNSADNGSYTVAMQANMVRDTAGNFAAAGGLGLFTVNISATPTPGTPALTASSDTGTSQTDNLTNLNNASPSRKLQFVVGSIIPGATVTIYSNGTPIGAAVANASTTTVTTTGSTPIADGTHTITARQQSPGQSQSSDSAGLSIAIDAAPPTAAATLADVTASGGANYTFTVTYADNLAIDMFTVDGNDIVVIGPNGFNEQASLVSIDNSSPGSPRTATYQIDAPGGGWSNTNNGVYTVTLQAGQVLDTAGNAVAAGNLGTFNVNVP